MANEIASLNRRLNNMRSFLQGFGNVRSALDKSNFELGGGLLRDMFPTVADDLDDEFNGEGALDAKWTATNDPAGADAFNQTDYEGYLHVGLLELGAGGGTFANSIRLHQPPPAGNQTLEFMAKVSLGQEGLSTDQAEFAECGIYLGELANEEFVGISLQFNNSVSSLQIMRSAGVRDDGAGGLANMPFINQILLDPTGFVYLKLNKTTANAYTGANVYKVYFSLNGIIWYETGNVGKTFTALCDECGFMYRRPKAQGGTPKVEAIADFFRRTD